jgi:hypothetical protein
MTTDQLLGLQRYGSKCRNSRNSPQNNTINTHKEVDEVNAKATVSKDAVALNINAKFLQ